MNGGPGRFRRQAFLPTPARHRHSACAEAIVIFTLSQTRS